MKQWYEELFSNYGSQYESMPYITGTMGEADFIEAEIGHDHAARILDIGCGTGRHAIELACRGYSVVGIDLSESMLRKARANAEKSRVAVEFVRADARSLEYRREFDVVIMLCEGGFSLMETDEMNHHILQSAANALKEKGTFIFTALNGLFPLFHSVKDHLNEHVGEGPIAGGSFDLMTFRQTSTLNFADDSGKTSSIECNERYYVPSEISWLLKSLKFTTVDICGSKLGAFSRNDALSPEDFEMLVIARK